MPTKYNTRPAPSESFRRKAIGICEELYSKARYFARVTELPKTLQLLRELFNELMSLVDPKASPGWSYVWEGITKNKMILDDVKLREIVFVRFCELIECLKKGNPLPNPVVRIFVKNEPHKMQKILEGRFRLIWALPLEWQLFHRLFLGTSLDAELENHEDIPTKDGLSFIRGGAHRFYTKLDDGSDKIGDRDISGWDLSCPEWLMLDEMEVRKRLCLNLNPFLENAIEVCYRSLLLVDVVFADGTMLRQTRPGIVKSGSLITLSGNSRMQVLLKALDRKSVV